MIAVALINPKYPHNVGGVLRACSAFGASDLFFSGKRVSLDATAGYRLPREERMKGYKDVTIHRSERIFDQAKALNLTPVAVEVLPESESLTTFEHPENALYVFGPEDDGLHRLVLQHCHRFVSIPSRHCLNLAAAVNVVLYDRLMKTQPYAHLQETLVEQRGFGT